MLHRPEALAGGELDILVGDVVLVVDEGFSLAARYPPDRREPVGLRIGRRDGLGRRRGEARLGGGLAPEPRAVLQRLGQGKASGSTAGDRKPGRYGARHEALQTIVPDRLAVLVRGQVQRRVPAIGDGEQVAGQLGHRARSVADGDAIELPSAACAHHGAAGEEPRAELVRQRLARRIGGAGIDDRGDLAASGGDVARRRPAIVAGGEEHGFATGQHAMAIDIGPDSAGQHDARPVIARKHDRPFQRAGGKDRSPGLDAPAALARQMRRRLRQMVGDPLDRAVNAVVVEAEHGGARHDPHLRQAFELGQRRGEPFEGRLAADLALFRQKPATEPEILVAKDDAGAAAPGRQCGGKAGRPAADHQQVAEGEGLLVMVRVFRASRTAEAGGAADQRLVELLPEGGRPHEGLVVEAGDQSR